MRRTYGWKKISDDVSLKQLVEGIRTRDGRVLDRGTGMSKSAVVCGLAGLERKDVIIAQRNSAIDKGFLPTTYSLRIASPHVALEDKGSPAGEHAPVPLAVHPLVLDSDPQKTATQQTVKQERVKRRKKRSLHMLPPSATAEDLQAMTPEERLAAFERRQREIKQIDRLLGDRR